MQRFRKLPVEISAMQFTGENHEDVITFIKDGRVCEVYENGDLCIKTLEGDHRAKPGDWIICGVAGEFYPCKPDIFEATYEIVS